MVTDFHRALEALGAEHVRYVLIGGIAMIAHGSTRLTVDLDLLRAVAGRVKDLMDLAEIAVIRRKGG